ncbi:MAG: SPOR domain-containing protein, partial [Paracoccaceae bacterium]
MGCVEGADPSGKSTGTPSAAPAPAKAGNGREVEAPDVFQVSDSALWDGRPSLGGIWVASPDVVDPQRVVMVNPANGQSVNGALFRRERDNPGPPLQVSSDAAEALGMLAGQPTEIRVTALRRKDAAAPAAAAPAPAASDVAAADP